jgi:beta-galactosidase
MTAWLALSWIALLSAASAAAAAPRSVPFDDGWRFHLGDVAGGEAPGIDDGDWAAVRLPHTWNADDGDSDPAYVRGVGWYRKRFAAPAAARVVLRFGAANHSATVYVNGREVARHRGGYTAFAVDVTAALNRDGNELVAVRADNGLNPDLAPLEGDFTIFGGLYRGATLLALPLLHVDPLDDAADGVYADLVRMDGADAVVRVRTEVANAADASAPGRVVARIMDAADREVASASESIAVGADGRREVTMELRIPSAHPWDGRRDPYIYRVTARVEAGGGSDEVTVPFGVRTFRIDPDAGFVLNERTYPLHGVALHQDWAGKGNALGAEELAANADLIGEIGANAVRLAHYPHAPAMLDLLDRRGIAAWSEIPLVNIITPGDAFRESTSTQLREMIKQLYNHPAIVFWGLFNEIKADPENLVGALVAEAQTLDGHRLTAGATDTPVDESYNRLTDVIAVNRYDGWYYGELGDFGPRLDADHARLGPRALAVSEYGAGGNPDQHQVPPARPQFGGPFHPEEWQAEAHSRLWPQLAARPFLAATFVWNLADFAAAHRNEGGLPGRNDKGLVTYDRMVRKDAFYFYQACWSDRPMVHIASRRYVRRLEATTTITAYTNLRSVELLVDGESVGTRAVGAGRVATWDGVALAPGRNRVEVRGALPPDAGTSDAVDWDLARAP